MLVPIRDTDIWIRRDLDPEILFMLHDIPLIFIRCMRQTLRHHAFYMTLPLSHKPHPLCTSSFVVRCHSDTWPFSNLLCNLCRPRTLRSSCLTPMGTWDYRHAPPNSAKGFPLSCFLKYCCSLEVPYVDGLASRLVLLRCHEIWKLSLGDP